MSLKKAIEKQATPYLIILLIVTVILLTNTHLINNNLLISVFILFALLPFIVVFYSIKDRNIVIQCIFLLIILLGIIFASFRTLRDILPDTQFESNTSIGYAQYFGYPVYLDTVIFFLLVLTPFLFFLIMNNKHKNRR